MSRYRIRAVAELTGVSTATLRAWERRYNLPSPSRTASAYRLYGDNDVTLITQMRDLITSGVAPAEAARSLLEHRIGITEIHTDVSIDAYHLACDRLVNAALRFDVQTIREELTRCFSLGPATTIFDRILAPTLSKVGELWDSKQLTLSQEHLLSNMLLGRLNLLLELIQPADASRHVILACFEDEEHVFGLYGTGLHFAAWGYRAIFLGARTPPGEIAHILSIMDVDVVALSTTMPISSDLVNAYADACRDVVMVIGGRGIDLIRHAVQERGGILGDVPFSDIRRAVDKAVRSRPQKEEEPRQLTLPDIDKEPQEK